MPINPGNSFSTFLGFWGIGFGTYSYPLMDTTTSDKTNIEIASDKVVLIFKIFECGREMLFRLS